MSNRSLQMDDTLYHYLCENSLREPELFRQLREETARDEMSRMQIAPEQGQFLALLVRLIGARRVIEIGTYTGYSALWLASALPDDGELICCDISEAWTQVAQRYWQAAELQDKIRLRIAPALDTLTDLLPTDRGLFDLVFIDADKTTYDDYYECALELVRCGGLIVFDNMLWGGRVADSREQDADTCALRKLNQKLLEDDRIELSLIPLADGVTLAFKK